MRRMCWTAMVMAVAAILLTGCKKGESSDANASGPVLASPYCPIDNGRVNPSVETAEFGGVTVGFCKAECKTAWDKRTDEEKQKFVDSLKGDSGG